MVEELLLASLGALCTVLGTGLHTTLNTLSIQSTTDDVVANTGKVLNTAAADQNNRVLLQVVADTGDVSGNFHTVGQAYTSDLTQCRVRLLGAGGTPDQRYVSFRLHPRCRPQPAGALCCSDPRRPC